ncbi:acyl carrier protein [Serratia sp. JSRIV001]|uniref:acyl carrier protein n=1 Tax=Serratia TaxID=613 RepID=UPI001AE3524E|nr:MULTISPECIES: acyl carrier protein [Serratia]MBP1016488.1 acyl carrier protein [Serratia fonticola]UAN44972.1 acyl carrier protein [Serratia sp. JSRIV001]UAN56418.1 acyl carrier protein [Serratia sp. JSRIV004]UAN62029.1 acyl carrier protein [Serratia sp. JSRIV006]
MENYQQVYDTVTEMICDAKDLGMADLAPEMPLRQLKLDSLDYVELMVLAKREFGATLTAEMFINQPTMTLGELCQHLADAQK